MNNTLTILPPLKDKKEAIDMTKIAAFVLAAGPFLLVIAFIVIGVISHPEGVCRSIPDGRRPCSHLEMLANDLNLIGVIFGLPALFWMGFVYITYQLLNILAKKGEA